MLEYDMLSGEFLDEAITEAEAGQWSPTAELYAELRLLTVAEAEAERQGAAEVPRFPVRRCPVGCRESLR